MENSKKNKFELYNISLTRDILFGIATIWIMFFHSGLLKFESIIRLQRLCDVINLIKNFGNCGVDIFLILSGVGLYFSYSKNNKIFEFYKRRFIRILPSVIIVISIYYAIMGNLTLKQYINRICLLSFFNENDYNFWYFSLIIILYLMYPFIYMTIKKYDRKVVIIYLIAIITFNCILMKNKNDVYELYEIALTRIPCFIIGVYLGKKVYEKNEISKKWLYISLVIIFSIFVLFYTNILDKWFFIKRYLYCPFSISLIFIISNIDKKDSALQRFLIWIGTYSMEIYLIYENLARIINEKIKIFTFNDNTYISFYIAIMILTIIFAVGLKNICKEIYNKVLKCKN